MIISSRPIAPASAGPSLPGASLNKEKERKKRTMFSRRGNTVSLMLGVAVFGSSVLVFVQARGLTVIAGKGKGHGKWHELSP